jgi:FkbM family methyltransferase
MRRLRILFYWLFYSKNNIGFKELFSFLVKPKVDVIAKRYIKNVSSNNEYSEISFHAISNILYWPNKFSVNGMNQVTSETFDVKDWHYYQYETTKIENNEILLDIGTAEGLFPLTVIDKCKHIYMIEPSKIFIKSLEKTFDKFQEKTTIINSAVGSIDNEVFFNEDSLDGQVSINNNGNHKISLSKIDTLFKDKKITYLKADIEGFEQEMLLGAAETIKANKPKIAITTYHKENDPENIINLIKSYVPEYKYFVKGIHGEEPKPVMIHFWI